MRNFQDIFETRKRLFTSAFSLYMTVTLSVENSGFLTICFSKLEI